MKGKLGDFNFNKLFIISLGLNIIQISFIFILIHYKNKTGIVVYANLILYIVMITMTVNTIVTGYSYYLFFINKGEKSFLETLKNLEDFNSKLREQRHDYLNHMQVIYTLMELEEYKEAKEYIEPVYREILKVSKALKTSIPAVNALLQAKIQMAEENDINIELEIKTTLEKLKMEPWEFCKLLGNIIDNSIYALKEQINKERYCISIELMENVNYVVVNITNNGPKIPNELIRKIFNEGYTTKGNKGDGMGLFIVKSLVEKYKGNISVYSKDERTNFYITIPKVM